MDIPAILDKIRPNAKWSMLGSVDQYTSLDWRDETQQKPTQQEVMDAWPAVEVEIVAFTTAIAKKTATRDAVNTTDIKALQTDINTNGNAANSAGLPALSGHVYTLAMQVDALAKIVADLCVAMGFTPTVK